jgi:hypothetical protein
MDVWREMRLLRSSSSVRLEPGRHRSPGEGVCVVELASMVAGEKFTDRPKCVCPVIGSFLRCWNDHAGYADRQRLQPYASRVVGTGGYRRISRIRRDVCLSYAGANLDRRLLGRVVSRLRMRFRIAWAVGFFPAIWLKEGAGAYAANLAFSRGGSEQAFALLDRLLEIGSSRGSGLEPAPLARPVPLPAQPRVAVASGKSRRHVQAPEHEDRHQARDHRGHRGDLPRGDRREQDEEPVERPGADHSHPERQTKAPDHSHETGIQRTQRGRVPGA